MMKDKFEYLFRRGLIRPPNGDIPPDTAFADRAAWDAYNWYVPVKRLHDRKPTWAEIVEGAAFVKAARAECKRRIMRAYGAENIEEEILIRLRGRRLKYEDRKRDELLVRYRELIGPPLPTGVFDPSMFD